MQTDSRTVDQRVLEAVETLADLGDEQVEKIIVSLLSAVYEHEDTGNAEALTATARDIVFTLRAQRSDDYRKLVENTPATPTGSSRPVSEVLADLGM